MSISKPGVKLFRNTDLEELEQAVNEFCNDRWVYGFEVQVTGGETTVMVIYMRRGNVYESSSSGGRDGRFAGRQGTD